MDFRAPHSHSHYVDSIGVQYCVNIEDAFFARKLLSVQSGIILQGNRISGSILDSGRKNKFPNGWRIINLYSMFRLSTVSTHDNRQEKVHHVLSLTTLLSLFIHCDSYLFKRCYTVSQTVLDRDPWLNNVTKTCNTVVKQLQKPLVPVNECCVYINMNDVRLSSCPVLSSYADLDKHSVVNV